MLFWLLLLVVLFLSLVLSLSLSLSMLLVGVVVVRPFVVEFCYWKGSLGCSWYLWVALGSPWGVFGGVPSGVLGRLWWAL